MSLEASELEDLRAELIRARARGVRVVSAGGRRIEYASDAEMAAAIADLDARIAASGGSRVRSVEVHYAKGAG
ncbi:MAG: phage head-tail joining protein [Roseicyclus sp.]